MSTDFEKKLEGYGLTMARIYYRLPDFPQILQTFIWQEYDLAPDFPVLRGFLGFWTKKLEGPLHSVEFTHQKLLKPQEWRMADIAIESRFRLN